jgi:hypothetical protein
VFYDGATNQSYMRVDLFGQTTNADGYFVIGSYLQPNAIINWYPANQMRDTLNAIALHHGFTREYPNGTNVTGTLPLDAVVYGLDLSTDSPAKRSPLLSLLHPNQSIINIHSTDIAEFSFGRCDLGASNTQTTTTISYQFAKNSPGQPNQCASATPTPPASRNLYMPLFLK